MSELQTQVIHRKGLPICSHTSQPQTGQAKPVRPSSGWVCSAFADEVMNELPGRRLGYDFWKLDETERNQVREEFKSAWTYGNLIFFFVCLSLCLGKS